MKPTTVALVDRPPTSKIFFVGSIVLLAGILGVYLFLNVSGSEEIAPDFKLGLFILPVALAVAAVAVMINAHRANQLNRKSFITFYVSFPKDNIEHYIRVPNDIDVYTFILIFFGRFNLSPTKNSEYYKIIAPTLVKKDNSGPTEIDSTYETSLLLRDSGIKDGDHCEIVEKPI